LAYIGTPQISNYQPIMLIVLPLTLATHVHENVSFVTHQVNNNLNLLSNYFKITSDQISFDKEDDTKSILD